jgi:hypothetical protein
MLEVSGLPQDLGKGLKEMDKPQLQHTHGQKPKLASREKPYKLETVETT